MSSSPSLYSEVIFTELGKDYPATVLATRPLEYHEGADGEPLIHIGYFTPVVNPDGTVKNVIGTQDQMALVQWRYDVAHQSHSFSEEAELAGFKDPYTGGRYRGVNEDPITQQQAQAAAKEKAAEAKAQAEAEAEVAAEAAAAKKADLKAKAQAKAKTAEEPEEEDGSVAVAEAPTEDEEESEEETSGEEGSQPTRTVRRRRR